MCANPLRSRVLDHQESTRLQYGLVSRAQALGWAADRILVIDDDLGKSATSAQRRVGWSLTGLRGEPGSRRDHLRRGDVTLGELEHGLEPAITAVRDTSHLDR